MLNLYRYNESGMSVFNYSRDIKCTLKYFCGCVAMPEIQRNWMDHAGFGCCLNVRSLGHSGGIIAGKVFEMETATAQQACWASDWLIKLLHPTQHKTGHDFGDVPQANLLARYGKTKPNTTKAHIRQSKEMYYNTKLECGRMPNVMAALSHIGGALCSTPQSLADATTRVPCSNADKTRNPLKLAGVPQTNVTISAATGPKFTIL